MNMTRSQFLTSLAATVLAGCKGIGLGSSRPGVALQLYSIHKLFWERPEAILDELAAAGYEGVEFAGYGGRSAAQLKAMLAASGLTAVGSHVNGDIDLVGDGLKRALDFASEVGMLSLVTPHASRKTEDEYRRFGHTMGVAADIAARYNIKVGIHTTYHHFTTKYGNKTAWDVIFEEASPLLQQQIDTSNTFNTGADLIGLLKRFPDRHFSLHAKENVPTVDGVLGHPPTDCGACVPWRDVLRCTQNDPSLKWWIVEAEGRPDTTAPAIKCARILRNWLTA